MCRRGGHLKLRQNSPVCQRRRGRCLPDARHWARHVGRGPTVNPQQPKRTSISAAPAAMSKLQPTLPVTSKEELLPTRNKIAPRNCRRALCFLLCCVPAFFLGAVIFSAVSLSQLNQVRFATSDVSVTGADADLDVSVSGHLERVPPLHSATVGSAACTLIDGVNKSISLAVLELTQPVALSGDAELSAAAKFGIGDASALRASLYAFAARAENASARMHCTAAGTVSSGLFRNLPLAVDLTMDGGLKTHSKSTWSPSIAEDGSLLLSIHAKTPLDHFVAALLNSLPPPPQLKLNTTGWDGHFTGSRVHVSTGPTPFGKELFLGDLALSTDGSTDIGGQMSLKPPSATVAKHLTALLGPTLKRVTLDTKVANVGLSLAAAFDLFGTSMWSNGHDGILIDADFTAVFEVSQQQQHSPLTAHHSPHPPSLPFLTG